MTAIAAERILLLNASYEPLNEITYQRAARLLAKGKAVIEEACDSGRKLGEWAYPKVLKMVYMVKLNYDRLYGPPKPTRKGVLRRDNGQCCYCPNPATTIDHVLAKSRGGRWEWKNLVSACAKCNAKKADKLLQDSGLTLRTTPFVPKRVSFARL